MLATLTILPTSAMSPWMRFWNASGELPMSSKPSRDFTSGVVLAMPDYADENGRSKYDKLQWRRSPKDLKAISDAFFSMHLDPVGKGILEAASREVSLTAQDHFVPSSMKDYQNYVKFFQAAPSFLH